MCGLQDRVPLPPVPTPYPTAHPPSAVTHLLDRLITIPEEPLAAVVAEQFVQDFVFDLLNQLSLLNSKGRESNDA